MEHQNNSPEVASESTEMRREIGLFGGISVLGGIMIGSGIFYLGAIVLQRSGMSLGLSLLVWVIGGAVTLLSGVCYAELGAMMPRAGGGYVYLREAYGEGLAFMSGFSGFVLGGSGSIAALAAALAAGISSVIPLSDILQKAVAVVAIALFTILNIFGVRAGSRMQNLLMALKLLPVAAILVCGLAMGTPTPQLSLLPEGGAGFSELAGMVAFGVVATLWAYEGWTNLNTISEEIKRPRRNIPLALIISIVGVTALYLLFNYAIYRVLPIQTITGLINGGDYYLGTAAANSLFGGAGAAVVSAAMLVAILNSLNGCIMVFPRTYYAMARDGAFFRPLGRLHPKYRTPVWALAASGGVSVALVLVRDLSQLTSLVAFSGLLFNCLTLFSVIILRRKYPGLERPYKVWGYPATVIVVCLVMIGLLANTLISDPVTSIIGLVIPAAGLALYMIFFRKKKGAANEADDN